MVIDSNNNIKIKQGFATVHNFYQQHRSLLVLTPFVLAIVFAYVKPQQAADLWLTRDQQGRMLFSQGHYETAARQFNDTRWKAYSLYASEQFDQSATVYGQLEQTLDVLARANALAHARRYVKARDIYKGLLKREPDNRTAQHNIKIVQIIIDDVNRMSESQQAEDGDAPQELGDNAQTGEGAEKQGGRKQTVKQYDAQQLLLDPSLNAMWLRQVQKNPALFLSNKFHMQQQKNEAGAQQTTTESGAAINE